MVLTDLTLSMVCERSVLYTTETTFFAMIVPFVVFVTRGEVLRSCEIGEVCCASSRWEHLAALVPKGPFYYGHDLI